MVHWPWVRRRSFRAWWSYQLILRWQAGTACSQKARRILSRQTLRREKSKPHWNFLTLEWAFSILQHRKHQMTCCWCVGFVNYILLSGRIIPAVLCIFERRTLYFYISVQHSLLRIYFFRLALYVYEYLLHVGAQKSAQTFLSEVRMNASIASISYSVCICFLLTWHIVNHLYCIVDTMGKEYNIRRTARISSFLVVVSYKFLASLCVRVPFDMCNWNMFNSTISYVKPRASW
jgi:hypothetical protein